MVSNLPAFISIHSFFFSLGPVHSPVNRSCCGEQGVNKQLGRPLANPLRPSSPSVLESLEFKRHSWSNPKDVTDVTLDRALSLHLGYSETRLLLVSASVPGTGKQRLILRLYVQERHPFVSFKIRTRRYRNGSENADLSGMVP